ncbi:hypothetical protein ACP_2313 [Acidobacterium capsulatum ATCC 51196]|uniref:Uncharacterized protein n=1 Tax=Acidobacterium capsulatum (strain ATCC 51196 / DSM 11244 / BCRC 80197 / JCM 7670 / NBRC 15755 / NCIMB 13165 / 161) TaxID=240015 RepID=C1FAB4_ACIC5|nr:hypothetical protein ACP_2313 [Acidobacterium capsulatum ATCC 51196]
MTGGKEQQASRKKAPRNLRRGHRKPTAVRRTKKRAHTIYGLSLDQLAASSLTAFLLAAFCRLLKPA